MKKTARIMTVPKDAPQRRDGGHELRRLSEKGRAMSILMGRRGKLHESGLNVHQQSEPHAADKDDEKNNDGGGGANRVLFLDAFSSPAVYDCVRESKRFPTWTALCV
ncbi:uncharacterized protein V6R79_015639, partial [Siganus canaliculatus]